MVDTMDGPRARAVLGVAEHASPTELRRAFRERAKQTHPDLGGNRNAFMAAQRALDALLATPASSPAATSSTHQGEASVDSRLIPDQATSIDDIAHAGDALMVNGRRVDVYDCTPTRRRTTTQHTGRLEFAQFLAGAVAQRSAV